MKVPQYSASQLKNYDRCPRRWYFKSIAKLPDPLKASAKLGIDMHARLESHFRHGTPLPDDTPGKIAASGVHLLPEPGAHEYEVESKIDRKIFGARFIGYVDLRWHDAERLHVLDHKSSSDPERYGLAPAELVTDTQAVLYAHDSMLTYGVDKTLLRWVYYATRGKRRAFAVEATATRAEIDDRLVPVGRLVERMNQDRTASKGNELEPNFDACTDFGGCPFVEHCDRNKRALYASRFNDNDKDKSMGLRDKIKKKAPPRAGEASNVTSINGKKTKPSLADRAKASKKARGLNPPEVEHVTAEQEVELSKKSLQVEGTRDEKEAKKRAMVDETVTTGTVPEIPKDEPKTKKRATKTKAKKAEDAKAEVWLATLRQVMSEAVELKPEQHIEIADTVADAYAERFLS